MAVQEKEAREELERNRWLDFFRSGNTAQKR
jgi:hypothetical protein